MIPAATEHILRSRRQLMPKHAPEPPSREITPESLYLRRREFIKNGVLTLGTSALVGAGLTKLVGAAPPPDEPVVAPLVDTAVEAMPSQYDTDEARTPFQAVTT